MSDKRNPRLGLSLMEVLASIFVLSFGLLGVLSVIPYGMYQAERTGIANHGGNCLRAATEEIKLRSWNDKDVFFYRMTGGNHNRYRESDPYPAKQTPNINPPFTLNSGTYYVNCRYPIVVDPLVVYNTTGNYSQVPTDSYSALSSPYMIAGSTYPLPNVSIARRWAWVTSVDPGIPFGTNVMLRLNRDYQNIFLWQEDIDCLQQEEKIRSRFLTTTQTAGNIPYPISRGKYSWFFMVTPAIKSSYTGRVDEVPSDEVDGLTIDVVTCYNRVPGHEQYERGYAVTNYLIPTSNGGMIEIDSSSSSIPFDTTETRYALLIGLDSNVTDNPGTARYISRWYKIIYQQDNMMMLDGEELPPFWRSHWGTGLGNVANSNDDTADIRVVLIRGVSYVHHIP